jgi:HAD superfamily hydrolase (TIGR01509 family)
MDGTIVDTEETHYIAWESTFRHNGFSLDRKIVDANFGRNNRTIIPLFLGFEPSAELFQKLVDEKESYFRKIVLDHAKLTHGAETWFAAASAAKMRQVVASSASMVNIDWIIDGYNIRSYFDYLVSGADLPAKPDPAVFLEAAERIHLPPENCCVIEDSTAGVLAAKQAGMACIAVRNSLSSENLDLADDIVNDFTEPMAEVFSRLGFAQDLF